MAAPVNLGARTLAVVAAVAVAATLVAGSIAARLSPAFAAAPGACLMRAEFIAPAPLPIVPGVASDAFDVEPRTVLPPRRPVYRYCDALLRVGYDEDLSTRNAPARVWASTPPAGSGLLPS